MKKSYTVGQAKYGCDVPTNVTFYTPHGWESGVLHGEMITNRAGEQIYIEEVLFDARLDNIENPIVINR